MIPDLTVSQDDMRLIHAIVRRARSMFGSTEMPTLAMDLCATAANGCPMRFADMLTGSNFDFAHDVFGIMNNIDRDTGKLSRFMPRFAAQP